MTIIFQRNAHVTRLLFGLVVLFNPSAADVRTAFAATRTAHDVVVYGATPAGVAAAVAAAREGKSVALVEPLQLAGGMMSGGLSFSDSNQTARETLGGIFEEFYLRVETRYADRGIKLPYEVRVKDNKPWTCEPHVAEQVFDELLKEAKVAVHLGKALSAAQRKGNLLVPVCVSASHVAFSSVRVEPTWIVLGQSAGIAAAVAVEEGAPVQSVMYEHLARRLMKRGQVLNLP